MAMNKSQKMGMTVGIIAAVFIIVALMLNPFVVVEPGEVAVIWNKFTGMEERSLEEGWHIIIPFVQKPIKYSILLDVYTMSSVSGEGEKRGDDSLNVQTSDGQPVRIDMTVKYKLKPQEVWKLHKEIGRYYKENVIRTSIRSTLRMVVSKYPVIELYSSNRNDIAATRNVHVDELPEKVGREAIQEDMFVTLKAELDKKYIEVDKVEIRDIKFSQKYQEAIEQKQIAQQEAERMKYVIEKAQKEKEQMIIQAEAEEQSAIIRARGESEAIRLVGEMLRKNPDVISYEYVQKLSPNVKAIITDNKAIVNVSDFLDK